MKTMTMKTFSPKKKGGSSGNKANPTDATFPTMPKKKSGKNPTTSKSK